MSQLSDLMNSPTANPIGSKYSNIGDIVNYILPYVFVIAGLILLFMLILGGIQLMTSAGNPDKTKAGYGRITHALIGFLIIFIAYFVAQLAEVMFGIKFL